MQGHKMLLFFLSIAIFILTSPFFVGSTFNTAMMAIGMTIVLFFGITVVSVSIHEWVIGILLGLATTTLAIFLILWPKNEYLTIVFLTTNFMYYLFTIMVILHGINQSTEVNFEVVLGAVSGYLLIGLTGAIAFMVFDLLFPGSIHMNGYPTSFHQFMYFSFVTLTTLGFGDMVPLAPFVQSLTILLSVIGQIYLTVLVAMFVGTYVSLRRTRQLRSQIAGHL